VSESEKRRALRALAAGTVPARYERNLAALDIEELRALLESSVAVIGLGGLGGHVVESLARLGVGRILGVDPDRASESNLNRQILTTPDTLGESKARLAERRVQAVNPDVEFAGREQPFGEVERSAYSGCTLVFDCLDSIPARLELEGLCGELGCVLIHGAIAGWAGQVAVVPPGSGLLGRLYGTGRRGLEESEGNLAFTAAVAANLMVARAVPLLTAAPAPERGLVFVFDLRAWDWEIVEM
jgi:molybdopterin/thiamine biosynthesis adenylyltransferase